MIHLNPWKYFNNMTAETLIRISRNMAESTDAYIQNTVIHFQHVFVTLICVLVLVRYRIQCFFLFGYTFERITLYKIQHQMRCFYWRNIPLNKVKYFSLNRVTLSLNMNLYIYFQHIHIALYKIHSEIFCMPLLKKQKVKVSLHLTN